MIRRRIGIDTSVLVRLLTGEPPDVCLHILTLDRKMAGLPDVRLL